MPAGLFDPTFDPEAGPLELPQPAKKADKWKELAPLLAILPFALRQGGRAGGAALLAGFQQSQQQAAQDARQASIDDDNRSYRNATLQNQRDQIASSEQAKRDAAANAEAQRRQQFLTQFGTGAEGIDTPEAMQAYLALQQAQGRTIGVNPDDLARMVPSAAALSQKRAQKALTQLQKARPDDWMNWSVKVDGQDVKATDLLQISRDPNAQPAPGKDKRGFTPKDITLNGTRLSANYDPDTGNYYAIGDNATPLQGTILEYQKPTGGEGGKKPLTDNQRAQIIQSRRSLWQRTVKAVSDRQMSVAKLDAGIAAAKRGDRMSSAQTIITAYNKLLDETSVVREGEYARSEQMAPFITRIEAGLQKFTLGGAALLPEQLIQLANEAKNIAAGLMAVSDAAAKDLRQGITEELTDYAIPTSRVFGGSAIGANAPAPAAPASGGIPSYQDYLARQGKK